MRNGRIGEVMATKLKGTVLYLRPVGGGVEWEAPADGVEDVEQVPSALGAA